MNSSFFYAERGVGNKSGWSIILAYIAIPVMISLLASIISNTSKSAAIALFVGAFLFIIVSLIAISDVRNNIISSFSGFQFKFILVVTLGIIIFYILNVSLNSIISAATSAKQGISFKEAYLGITSVNQESVENIIFSEPALSFFSVVILVPLMEEIVFRQSIFLLNKSNFWSMCVSVFIFTLIHILGSLSNPEMLKATGSYFLISVTLAGIYNLTNQKLIYSYSAHLTFNLIAYILLMSV